MKVIKPAILALLVICCSCSKKPNTADIPGPWRLHTITPQIAAPAKGGGMIASISTDRRLCFLWLKLSFEDKPSSSDLKEFEILDESGEPLSDSSMHSSLQKEENTVLIFESQTGWYTGTKLMLSGMKHQVPFEILEKNSK